MKKFSIPKTLLAVLLTGVFVTGCSQNTKDTGADAAKQDIVQETESTEQIEVTGEQESTEAATEGVTFTDALGREVTVNDPKRSLQAEMSLRWQMIPGRVLDWISGMML